MVTRATPPVVAGSSKMIVQDILAAGASQRATTGSGWDQRVLNTVGLNEITGASLASNQITLPAGTYDIRFDATSAPLTFRQIRLFNVTAAATLTDIAGTTFTSHISNNFQGGNENDSNNTVSHFFKGRVTFASATVIELQHFADSSNLYGSAPAETSAGESLTYSVVEIEKVS